MPSRPTNGSDDNPDYIETMKRVVDIEAKKVTKEPLKESYSERRKRIDDKKKIKAIKAAKTAAKKSVEAKQEQSIKGWVVR
jgi:hypothetical protein